jgi:hypothetical protein
MGNQGVVSASNIAAAAVVAGCAEMKCEVDCGDRTAAGGRAGGLRPAMTGEPTVERAGCVAHPRRRGVEPAPGAGDDYRPQRGRSAGSGYPAPDEASLLPKGIRRSRWSRRSRLT